MHKPGCGVPEERWVDWHLKRLTDDAAAVLERHLEICPDCRHAHRYWGQMLGTLPEKNFTEPRTGNAAETLLNQWSERPSEWVRLRLRARMIRRSLRNHLARKPYFVAASGMIAVILLGALWLGHHLPEGKTGNHHPAALPPMEYARLHEPHGAQLMQQPDTLVFTASSAITPGMPAPDFPGRSSVIVWANPRTGEIFVLMDGLLPAESRDVQVWGLSGRQMTNLGLIKFNHWQGHLYSQLYSLWELEELYFTIEPKGGSLQPTAPETAKLRLFAGS